MEIKPEILNNCSLLQACEWIAFGWEPTTPYYEYLLNYQRPTNSKYVSKRFKYENKKLAEQNENLNTQDYDNKIQDAIRKLEYLIIKNKIDIEETYFEPSRLLGKRKLKPSEDMSLDLVNNSINQFVNKFQDINISVKQLKAAFIENDNINNKSEYLSPYLKIMLNIIKDMNISKDNQPDIKIIEIEIKDNYKEDISKYDISDTTIKQMASLTLLPENRKGKASKKNKR